MLRQARQGIVMSTNPKKAPPQESLEMIEAEDVQKSVSPAAAVTDIAEYRPHEEQIVRLETTYSKLVVDCSTSEGLASAKEVRVDIRDVRYALDKTTCLLYTSDAADEGER